MDNSIIESMCRYIGQTVTIFTTSGGISGSGFTGVLISVDDCVVRLLCEMAYPPACAIGSACAPDVAYGGGYGGYGGYGGGSGCGCGRNRCGCGGGGYGGGEFEAFAGVNPLGAVAEIPTCAIACFTHNAI